MKLEIHLPNSINTTFNRFNSADISCKSLQERIKKSSNTFLEEGRFHVPKEH